MELFRFHKNENATVNRQNIDKTRYKYGNLLIFACFFLYTTSMAAKGVFAAESQYIKDLWSIEDFSLVSMTNTFYFVTYGLVQVGLFFVMKKINIRKYMIFSIPFAAIAMICMGFANNIYVMWVFFGLTGLFQAGIYCGCTYMLTENLPSKLLTKANKIMNVGYAVGTLVAYGLCALCVRFNLWQIPYYALGGLFFVAVVVFAIIATVATRFKHINELLDEKKKTNEKDVNNLDEPLFTLETKKKTVWFYVIDMVMSFFITCLFYAVMNYITSLLVTVHGVSQDISIYVTMIAPAAISIGPIVAISMCDKTIDFIRQGLYMLIVLLPISALLALFYNANLYLALALCIIFIVIANGVKAVVLSVIAFRMRKVINSGSYSAISNALASLAAGVAPTVIGAIIDVSGWAASYWVIFALVAALIIATLIIDIYIRRAYRKAHHLANNEKI